MELSKSSLNPYSYLGTLHNQGLDFVRERLKTRTGFKEKDIIELTSEYMCIIEQGIQCQTVNNAKKQFHPSIQQAVYFEFLSRLHNEMQIKGWKELAKGANVSAFTETQLDAFFSILYLDDRPYDLIFETLGGALLHSSATDEEKKLPLIAFAIAQASLEYRKSFSRAANKKPEPPTGSASEKKKEFCWPWKEDAKGAVTGFISGGIGGALLGVAGAATAGLLGAVGNAVSNSAIEIFSYFKP